MVLTQNGLNYICQNFGDVNHCCAETGLTWTYFADGVQTTESGGTVLLIGELVFGSAMNIPITIISPSGRGTYTLANLTTANDGQSIDLTVDIRDNIGAHDTPDAPGGQYCYQGTNVTCWRCNGTTPESSTFPSGTVCGQGVAASYPEFTQPSCGGTTVTCWRCNGTTPESSTFPSGTVCGQGAASNYIYSTQPQCNAGDVTCWRCNLFTPEPMDFPAGTICGATYAVDYPYGVKPTCTPNMLMLGAMVAAVGLVGIVLLVGRKKNK